MNEIDFRYWLINNGVKGKIASDTISRLKRIEKEIKNCDIDEEYRSDRCTKLMSMFLNMGENELMKEQPACKLPVGKYYMSTYRHALKQYITFCDFIALSKQ